MNALTAFCSRTHDNDVSDEELKGYIAEELGVDKGDFDLQTDTGKIRLGPAPPSP